MKRDSPAELEQLQLHHHLSKTSKYQLRQPLQEEDFRPALIQLPKYAMHLEQHQHSVTIPVLKLKEFAKQVMQSVTRPTLLQLAQNRSQQL
jgi:hypothetical protein